MSAPSSSLKAIGTIVHIGQTQEISERFKKREFVLELGDNPEYPEHVKFEAIQDKCGHLDKYGIGQEIEVKFNLKGRKWTSPKTGEDNYFNTLQAWSFFSTSEPKRTKEGLKDKTPEPVWEFELEGDEDDGDLPF